MGYFCNKICNQDLSKMSQSGHTESTMTMSKFCYVCLQLSDKSCLFSFNELGQLLKQVKLTIWPNQHYLCTVLRASQGNIYTRGRCLYRLCSCQFNGRIGCWFIVEYLLLLANNQALIWLTTAHAVPTPSPV